MPTAMATARSSMTDYATLSAMCASVLGVGFAVPEEDYYDICYTVQKRAGNVDAPGQAVCQGSRERAPLPPQPLPPMTFPTTCRLRYLSDSESDSDDDHGDYDDDERVETTPHLSDFPNSPDSAASESCDLPKTPEDSQFPTLVDTPKQPTLLSASTVAGPAAGTLKRPRDPLDLMPLPPSKRLPGSSASCVTHTANRAERSELQRQEAQVTRRKQLAALEHAKVHSRTFFSKSAFQRFSVRFQPAAQARDLNARNSSSGASG